MSQSDVDSLRRRLDNRRNIPPASGIRVPAAAMADFVAALGRAVDMPSEDARLLGRILAANDLRCLFSHGTQAVVDYVHQVRAGRVNPRPQTKTLRQSAAALALDGDGGLGYFPCWRGTQAIIAKAKEGGAAALSTYNHYHFGAAGNYTRLALAQDCIGLSFSSHQMDRSAANPVHSIVTSSPVSVALPAGDQPPFVLDMAGSILGFDRDHYAQNPAPFFKNLGLTTIIQLLGGVFAGIYREEVKPPHSRWKSNQGSFILVVDPSHFWPLAEFKREMDRFIGQTRRMEPMPGLDRAELSGGFEHGWAAENEEKGIPVSPNHQEKLAAIAAELDLNTPFAAYEQTRFG